MHLCFGLKEDKSLSGFRLFSLEGVSVWQRDRSLYLEEVSLLERERQ